MTEHSQQFPSREEMVKIVSEESGLDISSISSLSDEMLQKQYLRWVNQESGGKISIHVLPDKRNGLQSNLEG